MCAVEMRVEVDDFGNETYTFEKGGCSVFMDADELALRCKAHGIEPASDDFVVEMGQLLFPDLASDNPYLNDRPFMPDTGDVDMDAVLAAMERMGVSYA